MILSYATLVYGISLLCFLMPHYTIFHRSEKDKKNTNKFIFSTSIKDEFGFARVQLVKILPSPSMLSTGRAKACFPTTGASGRLYERTS